VKRGQRLVDPSDGEKVDDWSSPMVLTSKVLKEFDSACFIQEAFGLRHQA
jgi:hypothetical protein